MPRRLRRAVLALLCAASLAAAQPGAVIAPRANSGTPGPDELTNVLKDKFQGRTYQSRLHASDLLPTSVITPATLSGAFGDAGAVFPLRRGQPATVQYRVLAANLAGMPIGAQIDRLAFRARPNSFSWPVGAPAVFANYEITLSGDANPAAGLSVTFANNQLNPVQVRRGSLVLPPSAIPPAPTGPDVFARDITFDRPYTYTGGNILVTITHDGDTGVSSNPILDASVQAAGSTAIIQTAFRGATGTLSTVLPTIRFGIAGVPIGADIVGIRWRQDETSGPGPRPTDACAFTAFGLVMAEDANPAAPLAPSFNANELRPVTLRSGPLTIDRNTFPFASPGPSPFPGLSFGNPATAAFTYPGGNIVYRLTHTGSDNSPFITPDAAQHNGSLLATSGSASSGSAAPTAVTRVDYCTTGTAIAPRSASNSHATNRGSTILISPGRRRYQMQYSADQLAGITRGDTITAIEFTSNPSSAGTAWPPADARFDEFEITLSRAANPISAFSTTFDANNAAPVLVRSGPLTIPAGSLDPARPYAYSIPVAPYQYEGGDLVVTIRHTGTGVNNPTWVAAAVDGDGATCAAISASDADAPAGTLNFAMVTRFRTRPPAMPDVVFTTARFADVAFAHTSGGDVLPFIAGLNIAGIRCQLGFFTTAHGADLPDPRGTRVTGLTFYPWVDSAQTDLFNSARVRIFRGRPGDPDAAVIASGNTVAESAFTDIYLGDTFSTRRIWRIRVNLDVPRVLGPGAYWFDFGAGTDTNTPIWIAPLPDDCGRRIPGSAMLVTTTDQPANFDVNMSVPFEVHGAPVTCLADIDNSGEVDLTDFFAFFNCFSNADLCADLNADDQTDLSDFFAFFNAFSDGC